MKAMIKEFKEFAFKGNLVDMAVGIIIGGAFGTVIKSLVDDIFMPILGRITGGLDFSNKFLVLAGEVPENASLETAQKVDGVNLLTYGNFATAFVSFIILAFVLFLVINKFMAALKKEEEKPVEEKKVSEDVALLTEIRDLLKAK